MIIGKGNDGNLRESGNQLCSQAVECEETIEFRESSLVYHVPCWL